MTKRGIIIVHGTAQDIKSDAENTVKIAKQALKEGHIVKEIGGPGSTERIILDSLKDNPHLFDYTPIDEIGPALDYGVDALNGIFFGTGVETIIEELKTTVFLMIKEGVTEIQLVGFSRGAVSLAIALERIDKDLRNNNGHITIPVSLFLLDPVPGPLIIQRQARIPRWVKRVRSLVSKHEARPGFTQFNLIVSKSTKYSGDLVMGKHGDIGGSTKSDITELVYDDIAKFLRLKRKMTDLQRSALALKILEESKNYNDRTWSGWFSRQFEEWSAAVSASGIFEMPSATMAEDIYRIPGMRDYFSPKFQFPKSASVKIPGYPPEVQARFGRMIDLRSRQTVTVVHNPRAVVASLSGQVNHPPPYTQVLNKVVQTIKGEVTVQKFIRKIVLRK